MRKFILSIIVVFVFLIIGCDKSDELNKEINRLNSELVELNVKNKTQTETISKLETLVKSKMTFEQCKALQSNQFPSNRTSIKDLLIGLKVLAEHNYEGGQLKSPPMLIRVVSTHGLDEACIHSASSCKAK